MENILQLWSALLAATQALSCQNFHKVGCSFCRVEDPGHFTGQVSVSGVSYSCESLILVSIDFGLGLSSVYIGIGLFKCLQTQTQNNDIS